ncbi:VPLPA-CTERM sorting domain-containing protein [Roseibacterium sp. SDUM158017]|uniref:VPLPA-CTERM sorting domain-containing protein n=1 Tax=Roseicyclus salinarum TaxID=3036773 RepID=UPI0024150B36|nr:VPLPA-CTERM sorting domain-containing protein [Roseibacterium sp. SDUM158017]MDG4649401.1 VPLPA-CTERM sorting domain-containing protein [Roseibacterium sp. SDUM158017]
MAVAAFLLPAGSAAASSLSFSFSFTEFNMPGTPLITGVVSGLTDDATSAATGFEITSISDPSLYSAGTIGAFADGGLNAWTVSGGSIVSAAFFGTRDTDGNGSVEETIYFATEDLGGGPVVRASFLSFTLAQPTPNLAPVVSFAPPAAVPLPAGAWLLLSSLGAIALLRRRRGVPTAPA